VEDDRAKVAEEEARLNELRMRERFPDIRNFKGFRVCDIRYPMPTIMRWGKEEFCGPGQNTQMASFGD
jgi:hypothetical protein